MSFLGVKISQENSKFVTTVCRKPTSSGVYTHFESFLPSTYKFGMLYTLVYMLSIYLCLVYIYNQIGQDFIENFIFQRNDYLRSFIDKCFKKLFDRLYKIKPSLVTVEK